MISRLVAFRRQAFDKISVNDGSAGYYSFKKNKNFADLNMSAMSKRRWIKARINMLMPVIGNFAHDSPTLPCNK
jgi:hypothetical protein